MTDTRPANAETPATWAFELEAASRRQLIQARVLIGVLATVAVLEGFALILMAPLKTVAPIPILVDRHTGYVEILRSDGTQHLTDDVALTRSLLAQYVTARESFDVMTVRLDYHKVALWSAGQARDSYLALMPASNPASPLRRYPRSTIVETLIKSVSFPSPRSAFVRFETRKRDQNGASSAPESWISFIVFRFDNAPLAAGDRLLNPLGFQVLRYRKDPEVVADAASKSADSSSGDVSSAPDDLSGATAPSRPPGRTASVR